MSPPQPDSGPPRPSEDDEAQRWLTVLRDGDESQKPAARDGLAGIFERRGMLAEATELLETNARLGADGDNLHVRLASLYRRQGRPDLAQQSIARAAALAHPPDPAVPPAAPPSAPAPATLLRRNPPPRRRSVLPLLLGGLGGLAIVGLGFYGWASWSCGNCTDPAARIAALSVPTPAVTVVAPSSTPVPPTAIPTQPPTPVATPSPVRAQLASPVPLASPAVSPELSPAPSPEPPPATPTTVARAGPQGPNCPPDRPIKGNQGSRSTTEWIYHVPGGRFYAITIPEECFATEAEAQRAGYRRSLR